jgi:hypothetical protein
METACCRASDYDQCENRRLFLCGHQIEFELLEDRRKVFKKISSQKCVLRVCMQDNTFITEISVTINFTTFLLNTSALLLHCGCARTMITLGF